MAMDEVKAGEQCAAALSHEPALYAYEPLQEAQIRVIDLVSQHGEPLKCRLKHVDVNSAEYTALSYVWGNPSQPFLMEVEGGPGKIPLTLSLKNALQDLHDCKEIQPKTFWIDQLCINQKDNAEKSVQVGKMVDIYTNASRVVTYLGPGKPGDEEAIEFGLKIYTYFKSRMDTPEYHDEWLHPEDYFLKYRTADDTPTDLLLSLSIADEEARRHLTEEVINGTPWLQRLWIIQENVVNRQLDLLKGRHLVSWDFISSFAKLFIIGLLPNLSGFHVASLGALHILRDVYNRRDEAEIASRSDFSLMTIASTFANSGQCSDPRDRIYALLGLANDVREMGVTPDYNKPCAQVFTDLAICYIRKDQQSDLDLQLRILENVSINPSSDPAFPSWVPSLDSAKYYIADESFEVNRAGLPSRPQTLVSFESSPDLENGVLVARGIQLSPLNESLGNFCEGVKLDRILQDDDVEAVASTLDQAFARLGESDESYAEICQTMVAYPGWPEAENKGKSTKLAAQVMRGARRLVQLVREGSFRIESVRHPHYFYIDTSFFDDDGLRPRVKSFLQRSSVEDRSLWLTEDGHVALTPKYAQKGDIPVVFFGGRWIYFLRPSDEDTFRYLGWGYIHGFGRGEATWQEEYRQGERTFNIV